MAAQLGVSGRAPELRLHANGKYISARPAADYELKPETWTHLQFTYDGSRSRKGLALYINGAFVPTYGDGSDNNPLAAPLAAPAKMKLSGAQIAGFKMLAFHSDEVQAELLYASEQGPSGGAKAFHLSARSERAQIGDAACTRWMRNESKSHAVAR